MNRRSLLRYLGLAPLAVVVPAVAATPDRNWLGDLEARAMKARNLCIGPWGNVRHHPANHDLWVGFDGNTHWRCAFDGHGNAIYFDKEGTVHIESRGTVKVVTG